ncbi:MAG: hypothetical protein JWP69_2169 [Flaviaesturariibacter sp.]|nr:hypothetical protein [Flaviaesturariibacter sp.]
MIKIALSLLLLLPLIISAQSVKLLVGTYTGGRSHGIYVYYFNTKSGEATLIDYANTSNPSFLAVSAAGNHVYAVNENGGAAGGSVTAFSFDKINGRLQQLNSRPSGGEHPCYIALDKTGRWAAVGNYSSGTVTVLPVREDGSLGEAATTIQHRGSGTNKDRQGSPHVHAAVFSPDNAYLLVTDLGTDKVFSYSFNARTGNLLPTDGQSFVKLADGSGPRHLSFHPNRKWVYLVQELSGTVTQFDYKKGGLVQKSKVNILPSDYRGTATAADIHVSPNGKFLYASNRNSSNTLAIFRINREDGSLQLIGHKLSGGRAPRNFNFDPGGHFLLVANQDTNAITVFRMDHKTGLLTDTGKKIEVPKPVCIEWVK